jgi:hypothetical protein
MSGVRLKAILPTTLNGGNWPLLADANQQAYKHSDIYNERKKHRHRQDAPRRRFQ